MEPTPEELAATDKVGRPLTPWGDIKTAWNDMAKITSVSNPAIDPPPWQQQNFSSTRSSNHLNCPCPTCQEINKQLTPEHMFSEIQRSHFAVRDLSALAKSQDTRIQKLEKCVEMLTQALGVNEEFLSEVYKKP